jgi:hypothetical protein
MVHRIKKMDDHVCFGKQYLKLSECKFCKVQKSCWRKYRSDIDGTRPRD